MNMQSKLALYEMYNSRWCNLWNQSFVKFIYTLVQKRDIIVNAKYPSFMDQLIYINVANVNFNTTGFWFGLVTQTYHKSWFYWAYILNIPKISLKYNLNSNYSYDFDFLVFWVSNKLLYLRNSDLWNPSQNKKYNSKIQDGPRSLFVPKFVIVKKSGWPPFFGPNLFLCPQIFATITFRIGFSCVENRYTIEITLKFRLIRKGALLQYVLKEMYLKYNGFLVGKTDNFVSAWKRIFHIKYVIIISKSVGIGRYT